MRVPLVTTIGPNRACQLHRNCGQIVIPYANTNPHAQPTRVSQSLPVEKRQYAVREERERVLLQELNFTTLPPPRTRALDGSIHVHQSVGKLLDSSNIL